MFPGIRKLRSLAPILLAWFVAISSPPPNLVGQDSSLNRPTNPSRVEAPQVSSDPSSDRPLQLVRHVEETQGNGKFYSIPLANYPQGEELASLPIGVFDSGIGGLTVLEALYTLDQHNNQTGQPGSDGKPDFEGERFIYFGDQANMPYGNYSSENRVEFLRELILRDVVFLLGKRYWKSADAAEMQPRFDKPPVKAIVIACNTATAFGLRDIRDALKAWKIDIPVIGVVEAGSRGAIDVVRDDPTAGAVAILATVGTCGTGAYPKTIATLSGQQGLRVPPVCQQGSVGLAGAIEGQAAFVTSSAQAESDHAKRPTQVPQTTDSGYLGPSTSHRLAPIRPELLPVYGFDRDDLEGDRSQPQSWRLRTVTSYIRYDVATLVDSYRREGGTVPITTVVLGCTHFPLAEESIRQAFARLRAYQTPTGDRPYEGLIAEALTLINPGEATAKELFRAMTLRRLRRDRQSPHAGAAELGAQDVFFVSVPSPHLASSVRTPEGDLTHAYKYGREPEGFDREDVRIVPFGQDPRLSTSLTMWRQRLPSVARHLDEKNK